MFNSLFSKRCLLYKVFSSNRVEEKPQPAKIGWKIFNSLRGIPDPDPVTAPGLVGEALGFLFDDLGGAVAGAVYYALSPFLKAGD